MKIFLFIICIAAAVAGCKKGTLNPSASSGLMGTWELRHYSGTLAGVSIEYPKGNGKLVQFSADSTYKRFTNFKLDNQGTFKIVKNGVTWGDIKYDALYLGPDQGPDFMILKPDSLIIGNTFADGVTSLYLRQK
ncbi:hypothetical protein [Mucilaginibacter xinganensis]|uniref:Lipocalin-like domain-containing protein n=1 Tax=Mucilaginibacter xinganensis TaxID=1234841 RepID=A0A223P0Z3_9SPHI|nr:hypothetical protein [Mucilaginibacter xinganensis]ASU35819.1 hypothetical protein MuYL_3934 [Mucilaginibacter xinganensis]